MRTFLAVVAGLLVSVAGAVADAQVDNPEYKRWASFKPGAFVKFKMVTEAGGNITAMEQTVKLLELTGAKAVVEVSMVSSGAKMPAQKRDIPAKVTVEPAKAPKDVKAVKPAEGDEDVDIAGKKVKTHWIQSTTETGGSKTVAKVWQTTSVPGGTVKMEASTTGSVTSKTSMVATEWKN